MQVSLQRKAVRAAHSSMLGYDWATIAHQCQANGGNEGAVRGRSCYLKFAGVQKPAAYLISRLLALIFTYDFFNNHQQRHWSYRRLRHASASQPQRSET